MRRLFVDRPLVVGTWVRAEQTLLAATHRDVLLGEVRAHTDLVEGGARGSGPSVVPGVAGTGDGAMDDMGDIAC
jgi:hypothetical protein